MAGKKKSADYLALVGEGRTLDDVIKETVELANKSFGKGAVGTIRGKYAQFEDVRGIIDTGSLGLNEALGIGGYPIGRVIEVWGPESSGKTTLTLHAIASVQKAGGLAAFIDAEHAIDPDYAEALGVDLDHLLFSQPNNGEQALEIVDSLIGKANLIVVDSVAALVPRAELEGDMGDSHPGLQARLMSQALRKITGRLSRTNTTIIFINQERFKIGVTFGSPKTTSGGNALKFYASVRMEIARIGSHKHKDEHIGNQTRVKVKKNKVAPPFKQCEFIIIYGEGISWSDELLDMAVSYNIVKKSGSWYSYGKERMGQGRIQATHWLRSEEGKAEEIRSKVVAHLAKLKGA
jgi:recombination protein RecA